MNEDSERLLLTSPPGSWGQQDARAGDEGIGEAAGRKMRYELYYWPDIQGRGEFVRLALEQAGVDYLDVARQSNPPPEAPTLEKLMSNPALRYPPFALPALRAGNLVISQTANILLYLARHHGLGPTDEADGHWAHGLQLTIADFVAEVHDTHHPIASSLFYEDQRPEALRRTRDFLGVRLPKFLDYFETVLKRNPNGPLHLVGKNLTYVDLSMFQVMGGLRYAFPKAMRRLVGSLHRLVALEREIARQPRIVAYLASPRRIDFNEDGIFRHYPLLDTAPP